MGNEKVTLHGTSVSAFRESQTRIQSLLQTETEKSPQVAGTTSEENSETLENTTFVSSDQLSGLDNEHIAFLLYHLVDNGTDKSFLELYHIGNTFANIAANLKR